MRVPQGSLLVGQTIKDNRLADAFGIEVLGLRRSGTTDLLPDPDTVLRAGDLLLVEAEHDDILILQGLQGIDILLGPLPELISLQSDEVGLIEVVLSPFTTMVGKTLRELHFREKIGLSVLAIWRSGRAFRSRLRDMQLRFGDALLLYGPRSRHHLLRSEQDLLVLTQSTKETTRNEKAPVAILIMAGVILPVVLHWIPIELSAVIGATLMVLFGVLNMDEAYRAIDWRSVFLIAGMLPLGIAMHETGAAAFLASGVVELVGGAGIYAVMAGLFILAALSSQVIPSAALAVIMVPIAIGTATELGVSPYTLAMLIAVAISTNFLSPVAHPANSLVMGPGGYRFRDFIKAGAPIAVLLLLASLVFLPILFPL
jgi:di/tricarboxylate transporter